MRLDRARLRSLIAQAGPLARPAALTLVLLMLVEVARLFVRPAALKQWFVPALVAALLLDLLRPRAPRVLAWADRLGPFLFLALSLMASLGALHEVWSAAGRDYFVIGGIVPYSDASSYLRGARGLLEFGHTDVWATRRVLPVLLYAVTLLLTGENLAWALWLVAAFGAVTVALATGEVLRRCGFAGALVFWALVLTFFDGSVGLVMTEPIGLGFATLGFVFLVRGLDERRKTRCLVGLALLQLGQSARPGALLLLPLLAAYLLFAFHTDRRSSLRWAGAIAATLVGVLLVVGVTQRLVTPPAGVAQASLAYSLYGLARGGLGWAAVTREHPELAALSDDARTRMIYHLAWELIRTQPLTMLRALWRTLVANTTHPLAFFYDLFALFHADLVLVPAVVALGALLPKLRRHAFGFVPVCLLAILISSPFLVDGGGRVFAASVFVNAALIAVGCATLTRHEPAPVDRWSGFLAPLSWLLLGVMVVAVTAAPVVLALRGKLRQRCALDDGDRALQASLAGGEVLMKIRHRRGSGFLVGDRAAEGPIPVAPAQSLAASGGLAELHAQPRLHRGTYLVSALNCLVEEPDEYLYFVFASPPPFGTLTIKARKVTAGPYGHTLYDAAVARAPD